MGVKVEHKHQPTRLKQPRHHTLKNEKWQHNSGNKQVIAGTNFQL
jgi:hypothetical protein